jgi:hypothetical protein
MSNLDLSGPPYEFGFLSQLAAISFPGGKWVTVEHTFVCDAPSSTNGEAFGYVVSSLLPQVPSSPVIFSFGVTGAHVLHSENAAQTIVYAKVEPLPPPTTTTQGAGVAVFNLSKIAALDPSQKKFTFKVITRAHGSSVVTPPAPAVYFVYATGPNWPYVDLFTTTTFDQNNGPGPPPQPPYATTNPFKSIGLSPASHDRFHVPQQPGLLELSPFDSSGNRIALPQLSVPPEQVLFPGTPEESDIYANPFSLASDATIMANWMNEFNPNNAFGQAVEYTTQEWTAGGGPPPPVPGKCSWQMVGKLFAPPRPNQPAIPATGPIVSPSGVVTTLAPQSLASVNSSGNNPPSYTVTVTVDLDKNTITMFQAKT